MTKIRSINKSVRAMKLTVPHDGTIEINANGEVEVSEVCAKALVNGTNDWEYAEKVEGETTNDTATAEEDEDAKIIAGIKKLSVEEMIETATEAGYPETEWKKFSTNKNAAKLMAAYLIKKYNEGKLNDDAATAEE